MEARYRGALEGSFPSASSEAGSGDRTERSNFEPLAFSELLMPVTPSSQRPWEKNLLPYCHFVKCLLLRCDPATLSVGFYFLSACCPYVTLIVAIILEQWGSYFTELN